MQMNTPALKDILVSELYAWDVKFLKGKALTDAPTLPPENLLKSLVQSNEARVRLSLLIPFLLRRPEFASEAETVDRELSNSDPQLFFRCYYTAAMLFKQIYNKPLSRYFGSQPKLPDMFSIKLGAALTQDPEISLLELAKRHEILSGHKVNWIGTYKHATDVWLRHLELQYS
ncbi:MAG: hypothetical protein HY863_04590 [Chloroflexi bacterium]|nr:hypothetical protein [Chloroflexota bacterium]